MHTLGQSGMNRLHVGGIDMVVRCCCSAPRRRRWRRLSGTRWPGCATGVQVPVYVCWVALRGADGHAALLQEATLPPSMARTHRTSGRRRGPLGPCRWPRWTRQASLPSKPDRGPTWWPPHRPPHGERARRCGWQCRPAQGRSPRSPCGSFWLAPGYRDRDHLVRQRGSGRAPLDNQSGSRTRRSKSKKGNRYLAGVLGRPPSAPAGPRPAKAPATGAWPAAAARPKPRSPSAAPSKSPAQAALHPRRPLPGPRPGLLLRPPDRAAPPDRSPRRQARRPRLRSHPLPHPRTRTRRNREQPGRLTIPPRRPGGTTTARVRCRLPS